MEAVGTEGCGCPEGQVPGSGSLNRCRRGACIRDCWISESVRVSMTPSYRGRFFQADNRRINRQSGMTGRIVVRRVGDLGMERVIEVPSGPGLRRPTESVEYPRTSCRGNRGLQLGGNWESLLLGICEWSGNG